MLVLQQKFVEVHDFPEGSDDAKLCFDTKEVATSASGKPRLSKGSAGLVKHATHEDFRDAMRSSSCGTDPSHLSSQLHLLHSLTGFMEA